MSITSSCWIAVWLALSSSWIEVIAQPEFSLNGSTIVVAENCYRLTSDKAGNDVGSLWCDFQMDLTNAFEIQFAVNFGCSAYAGEGIAFVMHTHEDAYDVLGCGGNNLGFGGSGSCEAITPSLALEMDTKFSRNHKDIHRPHLAVVKDGNLSKPLTTPIPINNYGIDVLDCEYHNIQIKWLPSKQELSVSYDGEVQMIYKEDLVQNIFSGQEEVYFGFTGSTSNQANIQMICIQNLIMELDPEFDNSKRDFENAVGIYPNPLRERLTIDIDLDEEEYVELQLYDSGGKLIYEIPTHLVQENQYYFNLPGLPSGVYYVTVTNGKHRVSKKIVHIATVRA
ncbi:MAG: T9SS type A sorting domain-containing protein [Saprospiraceae bacterium]|nr:T9SS type A sorting domain-containing protein [Saprospiraceae bacterium]